MGYTIETVDFLPKNVVRRGKWQELRNMLDGMRINKKPIKIVLDSIAERERARVAVHNWSVAVGLQGKVHTSAGGLTTLYAYMDKKHIKV